MNSSLAWYQVVVGCLLAAAVGCIFPFERLAKALFADVKEMWKESEDPDPLWAKAIQTLALPAYVAFVAAVFYASFNIGISLFVWWTGTLVGVSMLALFVLGGLVMRKFVKQRTARNGQNA